MRIKTLTQVRAYIRGLPLGTPFTTREVLSYGLRATVDQILCRFVKSGFIRRLARGVFVRPLKYNTIFSNEEIAKIKCASFQRLMLRHEKTIFKNIINDLSRDPVTDFSINGHSSKFKIGETTIHLKGICQRKTALLQTRQGERVRTLWSLGKKNQDQEFYGLAMRYYMGFSWLKQNIFLLPSWLSDVFIRRESFRLTPVPRNPVRQW